VLVIKRNFIEFSSEFARDYFGKRHEPSARVGSHGEAALEGHPKPEDEGVATIESGIGLVKTETVEFAMRSSARAPTWRASCRCFRPATYQGEYPR
jgi:hypothetical protein